jgi:hypothetical protein
MLSLEQKYSPGGRTSSVGETEGVGAGSFGVDPDQEVVDQVEVDWVGLFLLKMDEPVKDSVQRAGNLSAVLQLEVDPCTPAQLRQDVLDLFAGGHPTNLATAALLEHSQKACNLHQPVPESAVLSNIPQFTRKGSATKGGEL